MNLEAVIQELRHQVDLINNAIAYLQDMQVAHGTESPVIKWARKFAGPENQTASERLL